MSEPKRDRTSKYTVAVLKIVLVAVILYFLYLQVARHWEEIKAYQWRFDWPDMVLSVGVGLGTFFVFSTIWSRIMRGFGHRLGIFKAFRIFYLSNLGRYIPGKVWQLFGMLYLTRQAGIPPERAGASFVLVQLFAIPASFLVFVLSSLSEPKVLVEQVSILGSGSAYLIAAGMIGVSILIILWPQKVLGIGNVLLRKFNRPQAFFSGDKKVALVIFVGYCVAWTLYGVAFWLFVRAVTGNTGLSLVAAIGVFNAAYQIGYLSLFAPGGFGPRELVMGVMLTPFIGTIAPAAAVFARLWSIVVESIAAGVALGIGKE
jgi:hypothetical protein